LQAPCRRFLPENVTRPVRGRIAPSRKTRPGFRAMTMALGVGGRGHPCATAWGA
jgi:hypothetical protein